MKIEKSHQKCMPRADNQMVGLVGKLIAPWGSCLNPSTKTSIGDKRHPPMQDNSYGLECGPRIAKYVSNSLANNQEHVTRGK
jgi:hypothetical protein